MTRIFLAFLALLGLAVQTAPAQARVCEQAEIGMVRGAALAVRAVQAGQAIRPQPEPAAAEPEPGSRASAFDHAAFVSTTYIGIDRAAE